METTRHCNCGKAAVLLIFLAAAIGCGTSDSYGSSESTSVPPSDGSLPELLLISIDTLRADHMSIYGSLRRTTPEIDAWFEQGRIYEKAYTTSTITSPAMMSCLTGRLPQAHGVRMVYQKMSPELITIADQLRDRGYQTAGVVANGVLSADALALDGHFDYYEDFEDTENPNARVGPVLAKEATDAALAWLRAERNPNRPSFLWVHYLDPHGPYRPPDDKPVDFEHDKPVSIDRERIPKHIREPGVDDGAEYIDRYDEEIAYDPLMLNPCFVRSEHPRQILTCNGSEL